ncbi:MAG: hypothetical protein SGPRY_014695, partial [Prymnesium sp.]
PCEEGGGSSLSDIDSESDLAELSRALALDRSGRLSGVRGMSYAPLSLLRFLPPLASSQIREQCLRLETRGAGSSTFWMPAEAQPRCGLERLAKAIFTRHTRGVSFPPQRSGAEWWVQVRPAGGAVTGRSIPFHWDMDLDVMCSHGLAIHPHLSTVTYLTDDGGPTVVVEQRRPDEERGVSLRSRRAALASFPAVGKHFAFDGRFLHGAPALASPAKEVSGQRVTFLVNVWLGYTPAGLRRYGDSHQRSHEAVELSDVPAADEAGSESSVIETSVQVVRGKSALGGESRFPVMWIEDKVDVELSLGSLPERGERGSTISLCYDNKKIVSFNQDLVGSSATST